LRRYARALPRDWQEGIDVRAWLFTILHSQHVNYVRRAVCEGRTTAISVIEPELTSVARAARSRTRPRQTPGVLDLPIGTIRSRLSRGREALRQLMDRGTEQEETGLVADGPGLRRRVA